MSNYIFLWGTIILPWFTLPFLNRDEIKHYMPVALLGSLIATIVAELAVSLDWWIVKDNIFPFHNIAPYIYGAFPVGIIWIFKFTKKHFVVFMLVNAAFDFVLSYFILRYTAQSGILAVPDLNSASLRLFMVCMTEAVILFFYQLWQEERVILSSKHQASKIIPAPAYKRLSEEKDNRSDTE
ncbi:MAG: hypothetical protein P4N59_02870 [Negativicutes bacterium]|nr:hypothetical protein [Negativicutes bacterium]